MSFAATDHAAATSRPRPAATANRALQGIAEHGLAIIPGALSGDALLRTAAARR